MKRPGRRNGVVAVVTGLALVAASTGMPARAGGNLEQVKNSAFIVDSAWHPLALPVTWKINSQGVLDNCNNGNPACVGGVSPLTLQRAIDVLTASFNAWQDIPTSKIAFTYAGTTTQTAIGVDAVHLVTWADSNMTVCPSLVIATTPSTRLQSDLTLTSGNRDYNGDGSIDIDPATYPNGTILKAGTIIDADMAWCPSGNDYVDAPLDTTTNTFDIGGVGTHELGHFHGLAHSSLVAPIATMLPFVDNSVSYATDIRVLSQDDIASSSRYYPEPSFAANYGAIAGLLQFPGATTPATGVSVTAFDKATGEMAVQVFSLSQFVEAPAVPGRFRIDGLPAGSYRVGVEYFDSTISTNQMDRDDDWWDNDRFNTTIYNSNVAGVGVMQPLGARPEFLSSPENGGDDLADTVTVAVTAGATVDVGTIVINTSVPPAPAGATALALKDGTPKQVIFPSGFTFPFYGTVWNNVWVNDNGNVTFGQGAALGHTQEFLGPTVATTPGPVPPRIAFALNRLNPEIDNQGQNGGALDVYWRRVNDARGDRIEFIYQGLPVTDTTKSCSSIMRLFASGRIEIQNYFMPAWWGVAGVSPGGDGTEPAVEIDFSRQLPFPGPAGAAVYEYFRFLQRPEVGGTEALVDAGDLNGALLVFAPNAAGGYDVSSPDFVTPVRPGEVLNLRFTTQDGFAWDTVAAASAYNVYRGSVGSLHDTDLDGAADDYGTCLDSGLASTTDIDVGLPGAGAAFFYLVTGKGAGGEGILGAASSGAARPLVSPCP